METDQWIDRAIEGLLTTAEWEAFQLEVVRNPVLRASYVERLWVHQTLRASAADLAGAFAKADASGPAHASPPASPTKWKPLGLSLAACLAVALSVLAFRKTPEPAAPLAVIVQAENCKWAGSELPTALHSRIGAGTISLVEGLATLAFASGAKVTLEAPATVQILDSMHCRLIEGAVTAEVPEPAHGFTIDTADLKIVDLGTRFGVTSSALGNSQVRVFEGEVDVLRRGGGEARRLTRGKGMHVNSGSTPAGQEPVQGQQVFESGGWTAIPTSFGSGKDGYTRRNDDGSAFGRQPLFIVKHTDLREGRNNERRGFLGFDLSQVTAAEVEEAQLVLSPVSSGFGFSSLVPDSRFAVYGITDESVDGWDESALKWAQSPGCTDEGPSPALTRKLGEFSIPRGGAGGGIVIEGGALAEFVRRDTNGLVSFVVVRETGEFDPNGLAHGFASKEHPSARPPTLRIKLHPRP
jgi:ferric-dicitrate binding protein FerR (iron transport regulator)